MTGTPACGMRIRGWMTPVPAGHVASTVRDCHGRVAVVPLVIWSAGVLASKPPAFARKKMLPGISGPSSLAAAGPATATSAAPVATVAASAPATSRLSLIDLLLSCRWIS